MGFEFFTFHLSNLPNQRGERRLGIVAASGTSEAGDGTMADGVGRPERATEGMRRNRAGEAEVQGSCGCWCHGGFGGGVCGSAILRRGG